jgi:hypothetical protein
MPFSSTHFFLCFTFLLSLLLSIEKLLAFLPFSSPLFSLFLATQSHKMGSIASPAEAGREDSAHVPQKVNADCSQLRESHTWQATSSCQCSLP